MNRIASKNQCIYVNRIRLTYFYRAMLCISAVFAVMRCLCVCPSVTFVSRGVYTIESLEQMLQKNFRGEDLTSNQGGGMYSKKTILSVDDLVDT